MESDKPGVSQLYYLQGILPIMYHTQLSSQKELGGLFHKKNISVCLLYIYICYQGTGTHYSNG